MTSDSSQLPKHPNKEKKASKKWQKIIRNIGRHRELQGFWKIFDHIEPAIFFFALLAGLLKLFGLTTFIIGVYGVVAMVKKQIRINRHSVIYGINAVIIGLFLTILFWSLSIFAFWTSR